MVEKWIKVKTIYGTPNDVRKWLNAQPTFLNGTYEYDINPVDKDNKIIDLSNNMKKKSGLDIAYKAYAFIILKRKNPELKYINKSSKKTPFLDIGANAVPHPYATDALDGLSEKYIKAHLKSDYELEGKTTSKKFNSSLNNLKYHFNFDFNNKKLPYANEHFKTIYSSGGLITSGNRFAWKEVYRVLAKGGHIIFSLLENESTIKRIGESLKKRGYKNIKWHPLEKYTTKENSSKGNIIVSGSLIGTK